MESEDTIEIPIEKIKHDYFVYYNKVGNIQQISKNNIASKYEHVVTKNEDAGKIISGHVNKNHYCVNYNTETDQIEFMHKKYAGNLAPLEDLLYQIPLKTDSIVTSDVSIQLYPNSNLITIDINNQTKKRLLWGINAHDIKNPQGSQLNIYITKRDNPDYLILQVVIDPMDLITNERVIVELPASLLRYVDYKDISIFTRRLFDLYDYKLINQYVDFDPKDKHRIKMSTKTKDCHIYVKRNSKGNLYMKALEDIYKLSDRNLLQFHVVDATIERDVESRLLDSVTVSIDDITKGTELDVPVPKKFKLLHNLRLKVGQA